MTKQPAKSQIEHTPTPWAVEHGYLTNGKSNPIEVHEGAVSNHADVDPVVRAQVRADAAFIVRAVNCHEELLKLLKMANDEMDRTGSVSEVDPYDDSETLGNAMKRAIAKAEGK